MKPAQQSRFPRGRAALPAAALLGALALNACFFGEEEPDTPGVAPLQISPCVDVPGNVRAKADSLVASGNQDMVGNFQFWFGESDDWWEAKARSPQGALDKYEQALAVAPGHCQATFGRAMASASLITQDKRMDDFIRKVETADLSEGQPALAKSSSLPSASRMGPKANFASVFKTSPDQAAPVLAKLSADLERVDPPTVKEIQELIEKSIMPRLDNTIASLEAIMDYSMFAVRFNVDGDSVEIDRGEIGPGLAGLKVAKAWLTVVAGYNLDFNPAEGYDWIRTMDGIQQEDFDHLAPDQTRALDHLTGLFKTGSSFTRMKPAWKERIEGIPGLLLDAVGDAQKGLESVIAEARSGDPQLYDIWRAGSGEDADVDTVDLRGVIDLLERSKKYLTGEVPVEYDRGSRTIRVNLTRLFQVDGFQNLLPYFKFLPYKEWNDTLRSDTTWGTYALGWEVRRELFAKAGYDPDLADGGYSGDWYITVRDSFPMGIGGIPGNTQVVRRIVLQTYGVDPITGYYTSQTTVLADLTPDAAQPCQYGFNRHFMARLDPADPDKIILTADQTQGMFVLSGCRVQGGQVEYVDWVDAETKGPLVFTDAGGATTLTPSDMDQVDDPIDLKGKIIFQDPTFGGILPGLTNESVWEHVSAIGNSPGDRVQRNCRDVEREDGWTEWVCDSTLPSNPSDLDYLVYYLDWLDRLD